MKNCFLFVFLFFINFYSISAQKTQVNFGVDASVLEPDGVGPLVYLQFQKQILPKVFIDVETQFIISSEEIPAFRSQDGKPLAALTFEEDYPFLNPNKEEWFDKGIKQLKTKAKKTLYLTADFNGKYQIIKSDKSEVGISAGFSFSYIERQDAALVVPGQFESINYVENGLVVPVFYLIRYYDIGANVKINYTFLISDNVGLGFRASLHKLKSSHYSSAGIFYSIRF